MEKNDKEKNLEYFNRKTIIERTIDLIRLGFKDDFISKRTGLNQNQVKNIREIMEGR